MRVLFVIHSLASSKVEQFWTRNQAEVFRRLPHAETLTLGEEGGKQFRPASGYEVIVLVGSDEFFSDLINDSFAHLQKECPQTALCFWSPFRDSALANGLEMPSRLEELLDLIERKVMIPLDLIRCHLIALDGRPSSRLILNDALIRLPPSRLPGLVKGLLEMLRVPTEFVVPQGPSNITVVEEGKEVYQGSYWFAVVLLGNCITNGPQLREKARFLQNKFAYVQVNDPRYAGSRPNLPKLFTQESAAEGRAILRGHYADLDLKGLGEENIIIADGRWIGRLPASFTLLPKALSVISPYLAQPLASFNKQAAKKRAMAPVIEPSPKQKTAPKS